jgi:hypothetical protein
MDPADEYIDLTVVSDNTLGDIHLEAGAAYYWNEEVPSFRASASYGGTYPILALSLARNYRKQNGTNNETLLSADDVAGFSVAVPLDFSKGLFLRRLSFGAHYNLISNKEIGNIDGTGASQTLNTIGLSAQFMQKKIEAYQNLTTPLGFGIELGFDRSIGSTDGQQIHAIADGAIRGFWPNHNFVVSTGAKIENASNPYQFLDTFIYPRGYTLPVTNWMTTLQTSYHLPLFYPDFGMMGIFYIKRVRTALFADLGLGSIRMDDYSAKPGFFASTGFELILDAVWLNLFEIRSGFPVQY